ncbi:hypothetical protein TNCV_3130081 [Trichonephila clavipes]|nr:hypothetical protein TNCV_3130081 [Trichonephila clavipes]
MASGSYMTPIYSRSQNHMLLLMPPDHQRSDQDLRISSWYRAKGRLLLVVALSTIQVTVGFDQFPPQFLGVFRGLPPLYLFHEHHKRT